LREAVSEWAFGCDVCSEVCPWGKDAPDRSASFGLHEAIERGSLVDWLRRGIDPNSAEPVGSPLRRAQRMGLTRNAALGLGRHASEQGRSALLAALQNAESPIVREAAAWALQRAHRTDRGVAAALDAARRREVDTAARSGMERSAAG
jgi:epoxyqueuosine reductase QueG